MGEVWKALSSINDQYEISTKGRLIKKEETGYVEITLRKDPYGYLCANIKNVHTGKTTPQSIHRLVAINFINNPYKLPVVHHIDENKENNCVENLFWCTRGQNNSFSLSSNNGKRNRKRDILQYSVDGELIDGIRLKMHTIL